MSASEVTLTFFVVAGWLLWLLVPHPPLASWRAGRRRGQLGCLPLSPLTRSFPHSTAFLSSGLAGEQKGRTWNALGNR